MDFKLFASRVAATRKEKKISQQRLCTDLNISRATISSFENGARVDIGFKKVLQIIEYLGLEISLNEKSDFPVFEDLLNEQ